MSLDELNLPIHWVSKNARHKIIELMISTRSITELARVLGVSPTAIRKYIKRQANPSDEVLAVAIKHAGMYEKDAILTIIINDLLEAIYKLYTSVDEKHKDEIKKQLSRIIGS
ncbi:MAG: helix-turn-helix domain-containing protein [Desulfurococcaceae archaeon]